MTSISVSEASPARMSLACRNVTRARAEKLVEQLGRKQREQLGVAEHPLVAAAVEEQRLALAVAGVLDVTEEERVVAAPVRPHDARDEMRQRPLDERRVAHEDELRLHSSEPRRAKKSESSACPCARTLTPYRLPSCSIPHMRARRSSEISTSGGRSETDMNALAVMPCTCSPDARRQHGDARREHPERPAERDRRVALEIADVDLLGDRDVVERGVPEAFERAGGEPAGQGELELPGRRCVGAHAPIVPTGGARRREAPPAESTCPYERRAPSPRPSGASSACPRASASAPCPGRRAGRRRAAARSRGRRHR